jgi:hypothetical protein
MTPLPTPDLGAHFRVGASLARNALVVDFSDG